VQSACVAEKIPFLKMYDHVPNTHTCLSGKLRPGAGAALTLPFVLSFAFPKAPETHRHDRKGHEGLRTWPFGK